MCVYIGKDFVEAAEQEMKHRAREQEQPELQAGLEAEPSTASLRECVLLAGGY